MALLSSAAAESPEFELFTICNRHETHMVPALTVAGLFPKPYRHVHHDALRAMTKFHAAVVIRTLDTAEGPWIGQLTVPR